MAIFEDKQLIMIALPTPNGPDRSTYPKPR